MLRSILVMALLAAGTVACSNQAPGQAVPEPTTARPTNTDTGGPFSTTETGTSGSRPSTAAGPLAGASPCSLLTATEAAQLQAGQGKEERLNDARACTFADGAGFVLGVAIFDELGIADVVGSEVTPLPTMGSHQAVRSMRSIRTCAVTIEVTKTSRVDVQGTVGSDKAKSCELALRVATMVEPKLPD